MTQRGSVLATRWVYLRLLGVVWLSAFLSLWAQLEGLYGARGIQPAAEVLALSRAQLEGAGLVEGALYWVRVPTVFWWGASDAALHGACLLGVLGALLVIANLAPALGLGLCWLLYLSFVSIDAYFLTFQWDMLLLEAGFLAIFLAPWELRPGFGAREPMKIAMFLHTWLLARLLFWSGAVKLLSGDPAWRELSALQSHYWTQPLPTWTAWYAHQLPEGFQRLSVGLMLLIELLAPALLFTTARLRAVGALSIAGLMGVIAATGNYGFFNLLTASLCFLMLRDEQWLRYLPPSVRPPIFESPPRPRAEEGLLLPLLLLVLSVNGARLTAKLSGPESLPGPAITALKWAAPFGLVNSYGLFAVMTTERLELVVQGSLDGQEWRTYPFRWKPGEPTARPRFAPLHLPRLDWRMWFAALSRYEREPWMRLFLEQLLARSPEVLGLLESDPFEGKAPIKVRVLAYPYRFATPEEREESGAWWVRGQPRAWSPVLHR